MPAIRASVTFPEITLASKVVSVEDNLEWRRPSSLILEGALNGKRGCMEACSGGLSGVEVVHE